MDRPTDPENNLFRLTWSGGMEAAKEDAVEPDSRLLQTSQQEVMLMWTWEMAEQSWKTGRTSEVIFPTFSISVPVTGLSLRNIEPT